MEHQKILYLEHDGIRTYQDGLFGEPSAHELKELYSGAIVPLSLLNIHTLKLPDHLSNEELKLQVEIRMYEEGNLNTNEEYSIDFIRHEMVSETSVLVEIFALSHTKSAEYFSETLSKTEAIDLITPGFMIYGSLYDTLPKGNDLFLYWGEEESYGAIYQDGHYIAHRGIETLTSIAVETGLELAKLKLILQTKGLIEEDYSSEELNKFILIQERIAKNVERIVHTINHKRGLFGLSGVDRIYLDFEGKGIPGLEAIFAAYGITNIQIIPLVRTAVAPTQIHDALCASYFQHTPHPPLNLSPYERKLPWYRREAGKFLGLAGAALLIVLISSLFVGWMISSEETRREKLTAKLAALHRETASLSETLKKNNALLEERKTQSRALQEEITLYHGAEETASLISDMHAQRQRFLLDTTAELGRYGLGAMLMEQNSSKKMSLLVVADYRKRDDIAKLMSGLYERGYQDVQTREIKLDNNSTTYNSLVEVTR